MTGGGSVVMATHRSATATRNRVEPRLHHTLPAATSRAEPRRRHALAIDSHACIHRHFPTPRLRVPFGIERGHTWIVVASRCILRPTRPSSFNLLRRVNSLLEFIRLLYS